MQKLKIRVEIKPLQNLQLRQIVTEKKNQN